MVGYALRGAAGDVDPRRDGAHDDPSRHGLEHALADLGPLRDQHEADRGGGDAGEADPEQHEALHADLHAAGLQHLRHADDELAREAGDDERGDRPEERSEHPMHERLGAVVVDRLASRRGRDDAPSGDRLMVGAEQPDHQQQCRQAGHGRKNRWHHTSSLVTRRITKNPTMSSRTALPRIMRPIGSVSSTPNVSGAM